MSGARNPDTQTITDVALSCVHQRNRGLCFPLVNSSARTIQNSPNVYGGDWFMRCRFVTPGVFDGTARRLFGLHADPTSDNNMVGFYVPSTGGLVRRVRAAGTTATFQVYQLAPSSAYDMVVTYVHSTALMSICMAGVQVYSVTMGGTAATEYASITALQRIMAGCTPAGTENTTCTIQSIEYGNVALTSLEAMLLARYGWAALPQYVHAGGAGRVLHNYDFAAGVSGWTASGSASISAPSGTLDVTGLGGTSDRVLSPNILSTLAVGKAHRLKFSLTAATLDSFIRVYASSGSPRYESSNVQAPGQYVLPFVKGSETGSFAFGNNGTPFATGTFSLDDVSVATVGLCGSWNFDRNTGFCVPDDSGAGNPLVMSDASLQWLNRGEDIIRIPIQPMTADDFIQADQTIVPAGYEPFACSLERTAGASTGTINVRKTSNAGTVLFTGALAAAVSLTPTLVPFTAADKLHLSNSSWSSSTIRGQILCRRVL